MIPIINRFTCREKQLDIFIRKLNKQSIKPIIDYINENPKDHYSNYLKIKNIINNYPNQHFAIKLSSLNLNQNTNIAENYLFDITKTAIDNKSKILVDAENYLIQDYINNISNTFMQIFNKNQVNIYKTYQMYRTDSYSLLQNDLTKERNYYIGCKLVRGAYYNQDNKYKILYKTINETHNNYNKAIPLFSKNSKKNDILMCATHNPDSVDIAINNNIKNIEFAQLLGMSNKLTNCLANNNEVVYKYLPFGEFKNSIPYLTRRLYENYPILFYL